LYQSHFKLRHRPFDISPDPDYLWLGEKHREGLATLKYGILENKSFVLITGDIGTGKTALIRALEQEIEAHVVAITIPDPRLSPLEFYNVVSNELGFGRTFENKGAFLIEFKRWVLKTAADQRRLLMIIDEAHRLTSGLLEEIRLLSNIDFGNQVVISTFLVGQLELKELILRPENRALRQRISLSYELQPFTLEETEQYVAHRLRVAGAQHAIFTSDAIRVIHADSKGYPRLINIICDHALVTGFARGLHSIGPQVIRECSRELRITIGERAAVLQTAAHLEIPAKAAPKAASPGVPPEPARMRAPPEADDDGDVVPAFAPRSRQRRQRGYRVLGAGVLCALAALLVWGDLRDAFRSYVIGHQGVEATQSIGAAGKADDSNTGRAPPATELEPRREPGEGGGRVNPGAVASAPERAAPEPPVEPPAHPQVERNVSDPPPPLVLSPAPAVQTPEAGAPAPDTGSGDARKPDTIAAKEFTLTFDGNSTGLSDAAEDTLTDVAVLLKTAPRTRAVIEWHTDATGDASSNRVIAYARAASVRDYLLDQGIEPRRLKVSAYGADSNGSPDGRRRNSPVVIRIYAQAAS
jgi:general secretion pathway protein A